MHLQHKNSNRAEKRKKKKKMRGRSTNKQQQQKKKKEIRQGSSAALCSHENLFSLSIFKSSQNKYDFKCNSESLDLFDSAVSSSDHFSFRRPRGKKKTHSKPMRAKFRRYFFK